MPALAFLAVAGLALIALLFVADATLEPGSPPIVTSQRSGLPEVHRPNPIQTLVTAPAPAPDMTSQAVLAAQSKAAPQGTKIDPSARAARAETPPKKKRVARKRLPDYDYRQNQAWWGERDRTRFGDNRFFFGRF
jgi:hypothetical protein